MDKLEKGVLGVEASLCLTDDDEWSVISSANQSRNNSITADAHATANARQRTVTALAEASSSEEEADTSEGEEQQDGGEVATGSSGDEHNVQLTKNPFQHLINERKKSEHHLRSQCAEDNGSVNDDDDMPSESSDGDGDGDGGDSHNTTLQANVRVEHEEAEEASVSPTPSKRKATDVTAGYLYKTGDKNKAWKRRWCVIDHAACRLFYFVPETKDTASPRGHVDLDKVVLSFDFLKGAAPKDQQQPTFQLIAPNRTYSFRAECRRDLIKWLQALQDARSRFYLHGAARRADAHTQGGMQRTSSVQRQSQGHLSAQTSPTATTPAEATSASIVAPLRTNETTVLVPNFTSEDVVTIGNVEDSTHKSVLTNMKKFFTRSGDSMTTGTASPKKHTPVHSGRSSPTSPTKPGIGGPSSRRQWSVATSATPTGSRKESTVSLTSAEGDEDMHSSEHSQKDVPSVFDDTPRFDTPTFAHAVGSEAKLPNSGDGDIHHTPATESVPLSPRAETGKATSVDVCASLTPPHPTSQHSPQSSHLANGSNAQIPLKTSPVRDSSSNSNSSSHPRQQQQQQDQHQLHHLKNRLGSLSGMALAPFAKMFRPGGSQHGAATQQQHHQHQQQQQLQQQQQKQHHQHGVDNADERYVASLKEDIASLQRTITEKDELILHLHKQNVAKAALVQYSNAKGEGEKRQLFATRSALLEEMEAKYKAERDENRRNKTKLAEFKRSFVEIQHTRSDSSEKIAALQSRVFDLEVSKKSLSAENAKLKEQLSNVGTAAEEAVATAQALDALRVEHELMSQQVAILQHDNLFWQQTADDLKKSAAHAEKEIDLLRERTRDLYHTHMKLLFSTAGKEVDVASLSRWSEFSSWEATTVGDRDSIVDSYGFRVDPTVEMLQHVKGEEKADIEREKKWKELIEAIGLEKVPESKEAKMLARQGIPRSLRPLIWRTVIMHRVGNEKDIEYNPQDYADLVNETTNQVELDLMRTFPTHEKFSSIDSPNIKQLRRILVTFASRYPDVGYCQGMNMIAAMLLLFVDEETSFWGLFATVNCLQPRDYYDLSMVGVQVDHKVLQSLLKERFKKIFTHFERLNVDFNLVTFNFMLTIGIDSLPPVTAMRVLDCFWFEGNKILLRMMLAMFAMNESTILSKTEGMHLFEFFRQMTKNLHNVEELFEYAFKNLRYFTKRVIDSLRADETATVEAEMRRVEENRARHAAAKKKKQKSMSFKKK